VVAAIKIKFVNIDKIKLIWPVKITKNIFKKKNLIDCTPRPFWHNGH